MFNDLPECEFELWLEIHDSILDNKERIELFHEIVNSVNSGLDSDPKVTVCILKHGWFTKENDGGLEMVLPFNADSRWLDALKCFEFPQWVTHIKIIHVSDEELLLNEERDLIWKSMV
jgi:hypothetical protein